MGNFTLRDYREEDLPEILQLFYHTVHTVNARDYTQDQLAAWAPDLCEMDTGSWAKTLGQHQTVVATEGERILGFGDLGPAGYLDRLYVHRNFQGMGVATALLQELEARGENTGERVFTTAASITARPFFEKNGYRVCREQQVRRGQVLLTNFVMEKRLPLCSGS